MALAAGPNRRSKRGSRNVSAQNSVLAHIARPYAAALLDVASDAKSLPAVEKGLDELAALIGESADFANFLRSPVIAADDKAAAIDAVLSKAKTQVLVANFVKTVAANGRLFALSEMVAEFKALAARARGEVSAEVTSASPLSTGQLKSLADTLKKKIGKTVTLNAIVDPELIGGLQVKVGSQMIDSSLRTKLTAMRIAMKEVG